MTTKTYIHEIYDPQGNLLETKTMEMEVADENPIVDIVATLTEEQRRALLAALQA